MRKPHSAQVTCAVQDIRSKPSQPNISCKSGKGTKSAIIPGLISYTATSDLLKLLLSAQ